MKSERYEAPSLSVLGSISALTLQNNCPSPLPNPPGKQGAPHDASCFVNNHPHGGGMS